MKKTHLLLASNLALAAFLYSPEAVAADEVTTDAPSEENIPAPAEEVAPAGQNQEVEAPSSPAAETEAAETPAPEKKEVQAGYYAGTDLDKQPEIVIGKQEKKTSQPQLDTRNQTGEKYTSQLQATDEWMTLQSGKHTLDSRPYGTAGYETIRANLKDRQGDLVKVSYYISTERADWAYINFQDSLAGWVDRKALSKKLPFDRYTSDVESLNYYGRLVGNHTIDSKPWGTKDYQNLVSRNAYKNLVGTNVKVSQGVSTERANWVYIDSLDGKLSGWIDTKGVQKVGDAYTSPVKKVNYTAHLKDGDNTLDTKPWGIPGYQTLRSRSQMKPRRGQTVQVSEEVSTTRANWAYVTFQDGLAGWIDRAGLKPGAGPKRANGIDDYTSAHKDVKYVATIVDGNHTLDTLPWGIPGYSTIASRADMKRHQGERVQVNQEVSTNRANWAHITLANGTSGWFDIKGLTRGKVDSYTSPQKSVNYTATISNGNHTLDTLPWGIPGYKTIASRSDMKKHTGDQVKVSSEVSTNRADWAYITLSDGTSGWFDRAGLTKGQVDVYTSNAKNVNYSARLTHGNHTLDSKPWGIPGFETIKSRGQMKAYTGQNVQVNQEVSTNRADWVNITLADGTRGWIDAKAIAPERVLNHVPYVSQYKPVFAPWGCAGAASAMLLGAKDVDFNLDTLIRNTPMYPSDPNGQKGDVFTGQGFGWVINPKGLTNYLKTYYSGVKNITGASTQEIIDTVLGGNPVLYYGYSSYQKPGDYVRNHCKVITGYKNNAFRVYDPLYSNANKGAMTGGKNPAYDLGAKHWLPISKFNLEYNGQAITIL
ncbi:GW dipeptide domain-containing protein [Aerococcus sp. HMSC23C02]|uniref:GW dipeptide domain-containing protein n=1 Tax=Aerococcus sp. HMSC23C02 TaxID=1581058 RepID=UPI0008A5218C|nr:GW dipeptide domain-containing protein [Aerococcus sp. HMSC23C02]OFT97980.1 hypothetical protein HMPREF3090_00295 [Aerococcus sp. HMSC23C02]